MVLSRSQHLFSTPVVNKLKNNIILPLVVLFELGKLREEECMRLEYKYKQLYKLDDIGNRLQEFYNSAVRDKHPNKTALNATLCTQVSL